MKSEFFTYDLLKKEFIDFTLSNIELLALIFLNSEFFIDVLFSLVFSKYALLTSTGVVVFCDKILFSTTEKVAVDSPN